MNNKTREQLEILCMLDSNLRFSVDRYSVNLTTEIPTCSTHEFKEVYTERYSVSPYSYAHDPEKYTAEIVDAIFSMLTTYLNLHGFLIYRGGFYDFVEGQWVEISKSEAVNRWLDTRKDFPAHDTI